jgi:hypothetical protein
MTIIIGHIHRKRCRRCGYIGDEEAFFRQNKTKITRAGPSFGQVYLAKHSLCIGCELTERNDPTPEARALRKARSSIQHHAEKYNMPAQNFAARYCWEAERMARDVLHTLENSCVYCWFPYSAMGHGLDDITFDIVDRTKEPYYHTNVRCCCRTCNAEKSTILPELWARRLIEWRNWRKWMDRIGIEPTFGLPLFDPPTLSL